MAGTQRQRARELVLKALYAEDIGEGDHEEIKNVIIVDASLSEKTILFGRTLFTQLAEYRQWADEIIASLAENWDIDRIARIDRSIMQMALVELREMPDIPVKVVLNEAIELAKKYSTSESAGFVNGILDRYVKEMMEKRPV
jgi:N utilization substance protein B